MKVKLVVLCIILFYIYCYFVFPDDVKILQSSLNDFEYNMLLRRQPLVIEDNVKDIISLIKTWFKGNIIQDAFFDNNIIWNINNYKYLLIYSLEDTEILLYQAGNNVVDDVPDEREPVISITLKKFQSTIVPYRWFYNLSNKNDVKLYGVHDYVTYLIYFFT